MLWIKNKEPQPTNQKTPRNNQTHTHTHTHTSKKQQTHTHTPPQKKSKKPPKKKQSKIILFHKTADKKQHLRQVQSYSLKWCFSVSDFPCHSLESYSSWALYGQHYWDFKLGKQGVCDVPVLRISRGHYVPINLRGCELKCRVTALVKWASLSPGFRWFSWGNICAQWELTLFIRCLCCAMKNAWITVTRGFSAQCCISLWHYLGM